MGYPHSQLPRILHDAPNSSSSGLVLPIPFVITFLIALNLPPLKAVRLCLLLPPPLPSPIVLSLHHAICRCCRHPCKHVRLLLFERVIFPCPILCRSAAIRLLPEVNLSEGEGFADYESLLKCHIVVAHTVGACGACSSSHDVNSVCRITSRPFQMGAL